MDTAHRRFEIVSILAARRHMTSWELAQEFEVSVRTIRNDIVVLSLDYPIYTKPGCGGGIFMMETYKPFVNTLSPDELHFLCRLYEKSEGKEKDYLYRIIRRYGPDKLVLP